MVKALPFVIFLLSLLVRSCRGDTALVINRIAFGGGSIEASSLPLTFYRGKCCLFSDQVHLALLELGLDHEIVDIDSSNKPDW
jgi:hypothetical protein